MATEIDKTYKILMTPYGKSSGCTFSRVDSEATPEGIYKLGKGIAAFKAKSYSDIYCVTESIILED